MIPNVPCSKNNHNYYVVITNNTFAFPLSAKLRRGSFCCKTSNIWYFWKSQDIFFMINQIYTHRESHTRTHTYLHKHTHVQKCTHTHTHKVLLSPRLHQTVIRDNNNTHMQCHMFISHTQLQHNHTMTIFAQTTVTNRQHFCSCANYSITD